MPPLPDKDLPTQGDVIAEKYRIEGTLGSGGMSTVFKVTHCVTKKSFALKWMLPSLSGEPDAVERFIREAQVAGRFEHPNVVEVYDFGRQGDSLYMVMEFLQGENLASRLAAGPLTAEQACAILLPTARGVAAAHAAGVIHRDLKPQNIFLTCSPDGDVLPKVLDFGISKMTQLPGELKPAITAEGTIIGTPHYMAPEQICGQPIDERIDVYALGVILYEALTGEVPFPCNSYGDLILRITTQSPKSIRAQAPTTPLPLVEIVMRAMHRERSYRYRSVAELADALEQCAGSFGYASSLPYTGSQPPATTPWPRTPLSSESREVTAVRNRVMTRKVLRKYGIELAGACALIAVGLALRNNAGESVPVAPTRETVLSTPISPEPAIAPKLALPAAPPERDAGPMIATTPEVEPAAESASAPPVAPAPAPLAVRTTTATRRPATVVSTRPAAVAPAPGLTISTSPEAKAAPRMSTRRTHDLTQADF